MPAGQIGPPSGGQTLPLAASPPLATPGILEPRRSAQMPKKTYLCAMGMETPHLGTATRSGE
eukprot:5645583-Lingulodinium_polyedra.AAC.1